MRRSKSRNWLLKLWRRESRISEASVAALAPEADYCTEQIAKLLEDLFHTVDHVIEVQKTVDQNPDAQEIRNYAQANGIVYCSITDTEGFNRLKEIMSKIRNAPSALLIKQRKSSVWYQMHLDLLYTAKEVAHNVNDMDRSALFHHAADVFYDMHPRRRPVDTINPYKEYLSVGSVVFMIENDPSFSPVAPVVDDNNKKFFPDVHL